MAPRIFKSEVNTFEHNGTEYVVPAPARLRQAPVRMQVPPMTGAEVARMRRWLKWTQADAARNLGRSVRTIRGWELRPGELIDDVCACHTIWKFLSIEQKIGEQWRGVYD